jgi:hypothetical protein
MVGSSSPFFARVFSASCSSPLHIPHENYRRAEIFEDSPPANWALSASAFPA